jgi:hypothetical protein
MLTLIKIALVTPWSRMAKNMVCLCSVFSPADPKILSEDTTIYTYDNNCLLLYTLYYFLITIFHFLAFNKAKHSCFDTKLCPWVKLYYLVGKNVSFVSLLWQLFTADICTRRTVYRKVVNTNTVCICAIVPHYLYTLYVQYLCFDRGTKVNVTPKPSVSFYTSKHGSRRNNKKESTGSLP